MENVQLDWSAFVRIYPQRDEGNTCGVRSLNMFDSSGLEKIRARLRFAQTAQINVLECESPYPGVRLGLCQRLFPP